MKLDWTQLELALRSKPIKPDSKNAQGSLSENTIKNLEKNIKSYQPVGLSSLLMIKGAIEKGLGHPVDWTDNGSTDITLPINTKSLTDYIKDSTLINRIDIAISNKTGSEVVHAEKFVESYAKRMVFIGIKHFAEIETVVEPMIKNREHNITAFGVHYDNDRVLRLGYIPRGCALGILQIMLLYENLGVNGLEDFFSKHRFDKKDSPRVLARHYKVIYQKSHKETRSL